MSNKDNRKVYKNQRLEANGNCAFFDGKYDPQTDTLKVYRYYGSVNIMAEAFQNFCIDNKIGNVLYKPQ